MGVHYVDSIMALVIVLILAYSGGQVILDALKVLPTPPSKRTSWPPRPRRPWPIRACARW